MKRKSHTSEVSNQYTGVIKSSTNNFFGCLFDVISFRVRVFKFYIELKKGKHSVNNLKFLIDVIEPIFYFKKFYLVKDIIKGWNCNYYF